MKLLRIRISHLLWITLICCIGAAAYHMNSEQARTIDQLVNELDESRMKVLKLEAERASSVNARIAMQNWLKATQARNAMMAKMRKEQGSVVDDMREEKVLQMMAE